MLFRSSDEERENGKDDVYEHCERCVNGGKGKSRKDSVISNKQNGLQRFQDERFFENMPII